MGIRLSCLLNSFGFLKLRLECDSLSLISSFFSSLVVAFRLFISSPLLGVLLFLERRLLLVLEFFLSGLSLFIRGGLLLQLVFQVIRLFLSFLLGICLSFFLGKLRLFLLLRLEFLLGGSLFLRILFGLLLSSFFAFSLFLDSSFILCLQFGNLSLGFLILSSLFIFLFLCLNRTLFSPLCGTRVRLLYSALQLGGILGLLVGLLRGLSFQLIGFLFALFLLFGLFHLLAGLLRLCFLFPKRLRLFVFEFLLLCGCLLLEVFHFGLNLL